MRALIIPIVAIALGVMLTFTLVRDSGSVLGIAGHGSEPGLETSRASSPIELGNPRWEDGRIPSNQVVPVPDVLGLSQAEAEGAIAEVGLAVGTIEFRSSETVRLGAVVTQSPSAGTEVPRSSPVDLVISLGPAPTGGVAIVGTLETWAVTDSGSPVVPSTTFAPGDWVGVLVGVVDGDYRPLSDAQVTVDFVVTRSGLVEHTNSGMTLSDGTVLVRWHSPANTARGPHSVRVVGVERPGSTFDPNAGITEAYFTIQ